MNVKSVGEHKQILIFLAEFFRPFFFPPKELVPVFNGQSYFSKGPKLKRTDAPKKGDRSK